MDVDVIDIYADSDITWDNAGTYMHDGIYPNKAGMDLIADALIKGLEALYVDKQ